MKNLIQAVMIVIFSITANVVFAEGECDKYQTSYDVTYCYCKLFIESDKELNIVYKELKDMLKGVTKEKLTETQREWIKYRNNSCEKEAGTINIDCNYEVNKARTEYLRDRLRECKTGNCREDIIAKKSWE